MPEQQTDISWPRAVRRRVSAWGAVAILAAGLACGEETTAPPPPAPPPAPRPTTVTVSPSTVELAALDATVQLTAQVRDQSGQAMAGATLTWASSSSSVATVDASGLVTASGNGAATVTATAGSASGESAVTVMQAADSVIVTPASDMIALGDTLRLVAEAFDENGHRVDGATFAWSSNDASVARVDATGLVTGVAEGRAAIVATAGDVRGTSEIAVENPDRAALAALYKATDGPNWVNDDNWLTDAPFGQWHGVQTDGEGRVTRLDLQENGLVGEIPPELGDLSRLEGLNLSAQSTRRRDSAGIGQSVPLEVPEPTGQCGRWTPASRAWRARQPSGPEREPQSIGGSDPAGAGQPVQPGAPVRRLQRADRSDPARTRQPVQPAIPVGRPKRSCRVRSRRSWATCPA